MSLDDKVISFGKVLNHCEEITGCFAKGLRVIG